MNDYRFAFMYSPGDIGIITKKHRKSYKLSIECKQLHAKFEFSKPHGTLLTVVQKRGIRGPALPTANSEHNRWFHTGQ